MVERCDAILPVALHRRRMFSRRVNQAAELARHMALQPGKRLLPGTLLRIRRTRQHVGLAPERVKTTCGAFAVAKGREGDVAGKRLVLVDDVCTTGATVGAAATALCKAGAADNHGFDLCKCALQKLYDEKKTCIFLEPTWYPSRSIRAKPAAIAAGRSPCSPKRAWTFWSMM
jgi:predicted amidophosphoribosyltransferase